MLNDFNEKLAILAIRYALDVKPGDMILLDGSEIANDLLKALFIEVLKAGGHPTVQCALKGLQVARLRYGNDDQIKFISPMQKKGVETYQGYLQIMADYNRQKLSLIPPEKLKMSQSSPEFIEFMGVFQERVSKKELKWCIIPYACDVLAQDAKMDTEAYKEFVYKALHLDAENPAEVWKQIEIEQANITEQLNKIDQIHVLGEDTDLTLSVKGRPWKNSCGHNNLPDGEVFTSPVENSINGHIRFTYPGIYQSKEIENIRLDFKDGRVIKATAEKGQELLDSLLSIENTDLVGEFAVGTNYGIQQFTKNMLFDEKMGGTLHMAIGRGFPDTGSENLQCPIHWDILKDMKSEESQIIADGKVIYQAGKWKI
ncbi:hypothetical protein NEF87_003113 [Candidatus Lokiarchaeum ossiferum]|uniref:Aminopeptidase n=1 Tax=Candidatus Lokiarchaeum ossiferum TaxID=2951803 RepID=A0ABY6HTI4_9ARCH|nr:hypothetical protein NEF87_003113 [Candidatus Lokiarchaeum sp. B-35]